MNYWKSDATTGRALWIDYPGRGTVLAPFDLFDQDTGVNVEADAYVNGSWQTVGKLLLSDGTAVGDVYWYDYEGGFASWWNDNPLQTYNIPGTDGRNNSTYLFQIYAWTGFTGNYDTYGDAINHHEYVGTTGVFTQQVSHR